MSLMVVTINNLSPALEHKSGEVAVIANASHAAARAVQAAPSNLTSGNLTIPYCTGASVTSLFIGSPDIYPAGFVCHERQLLSR